MARLYEVMRQIGELDDEVHLVGEECGSLTEDQTHVTGKRKKKDWKGSLTPLRPEPFGPAGA